MKKAISSLLVITTILSILMFAPNSITAAEVDSEKVSASCVKTRDEAVAWLNVQEGARFNIDGSYGSQCSDFTSAYVNYVLTGDPYGGRIGVYNAKEYANAGLYPSDWQVIQNTASFVPEPGDIFVVTGADPTYGHTGVVISSDVNNATVADQNGLSDWSLDYGSPTHIHYISWSGSFTPRYFIRPCFQPNGYNPEGVVDIIEGSRGKIHVRGWAFDRDDFDAQIPIHVYIGGQSGNPNAEGHVITANKIRTDVHDVYGCGSWHGFDAEIETSKTGNQAVYVYAINVGNGNNNPQIGSGTVNIGNADTHIDLGSEFYAQLIHASSGKFVTQKHEYGLGPLSNVMLYGNTYNFDGNNYQTWKFVRQTDLSYTITNTVTNHCLEVEDSGNTNGVNVRARIPRSESSQRWYVVYGNGSSYSLVPKCAENYALDVKDNNSTDGTNIQIYQRNQSAAQLFKILQVAEQIGDTEYNGNRYVIYNKQCTWHEAKEYCETLGGHLATFTSEDEYTRGVEGLIRFLDYPILWIGATNESGSWKWVSGEKFTYNDWDNGQPDNAGGIEHYAAVWDNDKKNLNAKWNDFPVNDKSVSGFICEFDRPVPQSIEINSPVLTMNIGQTFIVDATVKPSEADSTITWTNSNPEVVTFANNRVTAKALGTAIITGRTINGLTAKCTVTVKEPDVLVTGITLNKSSLALEVGKSEDLIADVIPTNATNKAITWTSSNSAVATVSNGKVVAKSVGETTITAKTANGKTATCKVVVKDNVDPNAPQVIVESRTINAGKEFTVNIELKNNPGINGWAFDIDYDSDVIELIKCDEGVFNEITTSEKQNANPYHIQWFGLKDDTSNGVIAKLTFKAKENAEEGDYPIKVTYDEYEIGNEKDEQVHFDVVNGIIKVTKHLPGDVNGDGRVNLRDVIRLNQYVAGWNVTVVDNSTDINGDGRVNLRDVIRLNQYVAGWKVDIY